MFDNLCVYGRVPGVGMPGAPAVVPAVGPAPTLPAPELAAFCFSMVQSNM